MPSLRCLAAFLAFLPLAATAPAPAAPAAGRSRISDADLRGAVIVLERGVCYGACPAYRVRITGDGTVSFRGHEFVRYKTPRPAAIGRESVRALLAEFERAGFFGLPDVYSAEHCACAVATDNPSAMTTLTFRGRTRTIDHDYGCHCAPAALGELESAIDAAARVERWIGHGKEGGLRW